MNLLLCGLNSYLGRAALSFLPDSAHKVFGIVRDVDLLKRKMSADLNVTIFPVDLIKKGKSFDDFHIESLDLSIYFAQRKNQKDGLGIQYELLSLRNFIFLSKRAGCNRVVYVARAYDTGCLMAVEDLFQELGVQYTILLKDLAVGSGSSFERLMDEMLKNRLIYLYSELGNIKFKPILLSDLFSFIKKVNWQDSFICQWIEFGGERIMDMNELVQCYITQRGVQMGYRVFSLPSKKLAVWFNKLLYGIDSQLYDDYLLGMIGAQITDNTLWKEQVDFATIPIERGL
ncbi:hypothetical protein [Sphingobacterium sp. xlx-130]|nr:hypothetical protein [Sphingobacterium sp. xlx-130]